MIYATPFDPDTLRCSGPSQAAGFESIDAVVSVMGPGWLTCSARLVIYGSVAFSDYPFMLTQPSTGGNVAATAPPEEAE